MNISRIISTLYLLFFIFSPVLPAVTLQRPVQSPVPSQSSQLLHGILDEHWQYLLQETFYLRVKQGLKIEELPDMSKKRADAQVAKARYFLDKLRAVKADEIDHEDFLSLEILKWDLEKHIAGHAFFYFRFPITPYASPFPYINRYFAQFVFEQEADLDNYTALLKQYPGFINDILAILEYQYKAKYIIPKVELQAIVPYLEYIVQESDKSPLYVSVDRLEQIQDLPAERGAKFQKETAQIIEEQVNPAFERLAKFVKGDYFRQAPEAVGLYQYPGGKDYYSYLVKYFSSLEIEPAEIHQTGLAEVERLNKELEKIMAGVAFKGDRQAFLQFLRTSPRFRPRTPEEIGEKLMFFNNWVKKEVNRFFNRQPSAACGVERLDPALESTMTYGYYQEPTPLSPKGIYFYNASNHQERTIVDAAALILHELVPGHHFQSVLQSENDSLPHFRREDYHVAYLEGWAEYAAQLGNEMGIYQDPYDRCGVILQDLMMSVRLVVDSGMNYFGWSREKAVAYMKANLLMSDIEIAAETLRYAVDIPGQAIAYKTGSMALWKLRRKAEQALGERFAARDFHDAVLGSGSMPLTILEKHIDYFIAGEQAKKN